MRCPPRSRTTRVRFDHVGLTYAGAGAPSLTDISFTAEKGQTIGVIGGTGSGKSSLVSLIPRFYDATEGSVEIFGRAGAELPPRGAARQGERRACRRPSSLAAPSAPTCCGAIKTPRMQTSGHALETAQAAEFVQAKPLGLDEPVEQGGRNLSGGQKQRLTIARALVQQAGDPDSGRQRQRPGLRHGCRPAQGTGRPARQHDRLHRQPARRQPAAR